MQLVLRVLRSTPESEYTCIIRVHSLSVTENHEKIQNKMMSDEDLASQSHTVHIQTVARKQTYAVGVCLLFIHLYIKYVYTQYWHTD
jgi:hypothetical protein